MAGFVYTVHRRRKYSFDTVTAGQSGIVIAAQAIEALSFTQAILEVRVYENRITQNSSIDVLVGNELPDPSDSRSFIDPSIATGGPLATVTIADQATTVPPILLPDVLD